MKITDNIFTPSKKCFLALYITANTPPDPRPPPLHKNFLSNTQEIFVPVAAVMHPGGQSEPGPGVRLFGAPQNRIHFVPSLRAGSHTMV